MVWIRSQSRRDIVIRADLGAARAFLLDIEGCGRLMPSVRILEGRGGGVYHYLLDAFDNGAISLTPDYEARFDTADPGEIRWEPHGSHNFRSWGAMRTQAGPAPGETVLEIDTRAEADAPVNPIMIALVEPFARQSSDQVTAGFLAAIKAALEAPDPAKARR